MTISEGPLDGIKVRSYQHLEFCKGVECSFLRPHDTYADQYKCNFFTGDEKDHWNCVKSKATFLRWLTDNNFIIIKMVD